MFCTVEISPSSKWKGVVFHFDRSLPAGRGRRSEVEKSQSYYDNKLFLLLSENKKTVRQTNSLFTEQFPNVVMAR